MMTERSDLSITAIGSKFYGVGGCVETQVSWCPAITSETFVFDAAAYDFDALRETAASEQQVLEASEAAVRTLSSAPTPRYRHDAALVVHNDVPLIFAVGGRTVEDDLITAVDVYEVESDTWWTIGTFEEATSDLACFAHGPKLFCVGGFNATYTAMSGLYSLDTSSLTVKSGYVENADLKIKRASL